MLDEPLMMSKTESQFTPQDLHDCTYVTKHQDKGTSDLVLKTRLENYWDMNEKRAASNCDSKMTMSTKCGIALEQ